MSTCGHIGNLGDGLPCPDPRCGFSGVSLNVPNPGGVSQYVRAFVKDPRLHDGGYWCWNGPHAKSARRAPSGVNIYEVLS